jgi:hypothetical protein
VEIVFKAKNEIDPARLDAQIREEIGAAFAGIKTYGDQVRVVLNDDATNEHEATVKRIMAAPPEKPAKVPILKLEDRVAALEKRIAALEK